MMHDICRENTNRVCVQALHHVGLEPSSRLVELSLAISLPGASAQHMHTDITPSTPNTPPVHSAAADADAVGTAPLVTAWLALQTVTTVMGPTRVLPRSHHRFLRRVLRAEAEEAAGTSYQRNFGDFDPEGNMLEKAKALQVHTHDLRWPSYGWSRARTPCAVGSEAIMIHSVVNLPRAAASGSRLWQQQVPGSAPLWWEGVAVIGHHGHPPFAAYPSSPTGSCIVPALAMPRCEPRVRVCVTRTLPS